MTDPQIEKLLIVQDRDVALAKIERELFRIPEKRSLVEADIQAERARMETEYAALKEKEVRRSELDAEIESREQTVVKLGNQQLEVKKNEEYRALTERIELTRKEISELEEATIALMLEIDREKAKLEGQKAETEARIQAKRRDIDALGKRETEMRSSIAAAREAAAAARQKVDEVSYLSHYDRVKKLCKQPPYIVPIVDGKCDGCHLRVSNEVAGAVLKANEPRFCDQCGRMAYA